MKTHKVKFTADLDNPSTQKIATYIDPLGESKQINVRQYRRGNQKWTVSEKQDDEKQNKNTTQYVLDTTMLSQFKIEVCFMCLPSEFRVVVSVTIST
jgi:hypothetical protein